MAEKFLLKDVFHKGNITELSNSIKESWSEFDQQSFQQQVYKSFEDLSFSERNNRIAEALRDNLPQSYLKAVDVVFSSLGDELPEKELEGYDGFIYMAVCAFVSLAGMDHFQESMDIQKELTKRFTAEFSIRYFIQKYPEKSMAQMKVWATDNNCHVRRLASEGCRPRLPMSIRLHRFVKDPSEVLQILEILKFDSQLYVRRSVANNLNDIAKDHPDLVVEIMTKWQSEGVDDWLIKHALRTLFKQGNKHALKLCGYAVDEPVECKKLTLEKAEINLGDKLNFNFELKAEKGLFMVDYVIQHMKANGKLSPKVFKLSKCEIVGGKNFSSSHSVRKISTRKYYSGIHKLQIQVNGRVLKTVEFHLSV
ncbi:MAG: DNA alkylation repair protein [Lentisphaerales bacterium]|nr:DNA alkylation repair protein [Lentisphaerales bacterium]